MESKLHLCYRKMAFIVLLCVLVAIIVLLCFTKRFNVIKTQTIKHNRTFHLVVPKLPNRFLYKSTQRKRTRSPGEMGNAVVIPFENQAEAKKLFDINQLNVVASDMISVNRSLPDVRVEALVATVIFMSY
jgi:hypothetical protein